jgi:hypothetical protein
MHMALAKALAALMPAKVMGQASQPNIVFIPTDNLGYGEVGQ